MSPSVLAVIPARLESARLPRKLLLSRTGRPVLQHTWEAAAAIDSVDEVVVATDSPEIADVVQSFGGTIVMTGSHQTGTDRIAEAVTTMGSSHEIVVNIQGDEPDMTAGPVNALLTVLHDYPDTDIATAGAPFRSLEELNDPGCVKAVCTHDGRALYFSRAMIPSALLSGTRGLIAENFPALRHIGLYGFRREVLLSWSKLPVSPLEQIESLEQLRPLQAGHVIRLAAVESHPPGIDFPHDYEAFVDRWLQIHGEAGP